MVIEQMGSILVKASKEWTDEDAPAVWPCTHLSEEGISGLFFAGVPYRNQPTRVFAWLGLPEGASAQQRVPGVVLVHGGGGTAFARWVRWWCARGFAAIAMDTCGAMPLPDTGILGSCIRTAVGQNAHALAQRQQRLCLLAADLAKICRSNRRTAPAVSEIALAAWPYTRC